VSARVRACVSYKYNNASCCCFWQFWQSDRERTSGRTASLPSCRRPCSCLPRRSGLSVRYMHIVSVSQLACSTLRLSYREKISAVPCRDCACVYVSGVMYTCIHVPLCCVLLLLDPGTSVTRACRQVQVQVRMRCSVGGEGKVGLCF
jgi:hypothetical protein